MSTVGLINAADVGDVGWSATVGDNAVADVARSSASSAAVGDDADGVAVREPCKRLGLAVGATTTVTDADLSLTAATLALVASTASS